MRLFSHLISYTRVNRAVFYLALLTICLMAFLPAQNTLQASLNDKFLHTVVFFFFAFLAHIAYPKTSNIVLLVGLGLFGISIELVQAYLPYRSFEFKDWLADMSGSLIYFIFCGPIIKDKCLNYKCAPD